MPHLEITEVILIHCNIVSNNYQHNSRILHTFVHNKSFGQFISFGQKFIYSKSFNSEFSYIEVWFTD